jgi:hypothetical protein
VAIIFTFGTLITDWDMYHRMRDSFRSSGFTESDCEFLEVDNTQGNQLDAYQGLNQVIYKARGEYIILCHQDILAIDRRDSLESCLAELNQKHPRWAVCGNAGGVARDRLAIRISDPHGEDTRVGKLPLRVHSLDENFLLLRATKNLGFSGDLQGFHFYGTDICLQAEHLCYEAYVIDFHLQHFGKGNLDDSFWQQKKALQQKYRQLWHSRIVQTTCTSVPLSRSAVYLWLNAQKRYLKLLDTVQKFLPFRG